MAVNLLPEADTARKTARYLRADRRESAPTRQRDLLHRAQAYAQTALSDFNHYQGRAAADEAKATQLLAAIAQALTKLPP